MAPSRPLLLAGALVRLRARPLGCFGRPGVSRGPCRDAGVLLRLEAACEAPFSCPIGDNGRV